VHDATIYPVKAPNGSTVILYGHETGVGVVWRGGRPLKKAAATPQQPAKPAKANGTNNDVIMIIDSDDDEPAKAASPPPAPAEFDDEEEELDPDEPYPSFVQHFRLALNAQVLHIAVPQIPAVSSLRPADTIPAIFSKSMVFAVTCADCTVRIITLPLSPPSDAAKEKAQFGEAVVKIHGHQSIPRGTTMTWTSRSEPTNQDHSDDEMDVDVDGDAEASSGRRARSSRSAKSGEEGFDLLVATHSAELGGLLKIWRRSQSKPHIPSLHTRL
jgi:hypothetical protein